KFKNKFEEAMNDDFNTAGALAEIFSLVHYCRKMLDKGERQGLELMKKYVLDLGEVLGLEVVSSRQYAASSEVIEKLIAQREEARKKKNFTKADEIREKLLGMGVVVEDTPYGARWKFR
ncbi:MAG: DALR domain-containing protein, partial [Candidatus Margulisiibacteriota bacterium]